MGGMKMAELATWGEFIGFAGTAVALPGAYFSLAAEIRRRYGLWLILGKILVVASIVMQLIVGHPPIFTSR